MRAPKFGGRFNCFVIILLGSLLAASAGASAGDLGELSNSNLRGAAAADELWMQVNACIQAAITNGFKNNPVPLPPTKLPIPTCIYVSPAGMDSQLGDGFTILKDFDKRYPLYAFLTLPSKAVTGIEDPQINFFVLKPMALVNTSYSRNLWIDAWTWLSYTVSPMYAANHKNVKPRVDQMGLAINSETGRTQNQLHIHMACINKAVQTTLSTAKPTPPITMTAWSGPIPMTVPAGSAHSYRAIVLTSLAQNPFLVMQSVPGYSPKDPGKETLVLTGVPGKSTYYLLEDYAHGTDAGHGEELLDYTCATQP